MLPLPPTLVSINVIVCEKILLERDGTYSAIRIIDVFFFKREPSGTIEPQHVEVSVLVMGKISPEDKSEHWARLLVQKPDGKTSQIGQPLRAVFEAVIDQPETYALAAGSDASKIAGGFTIVANIKIIPRQVGMHHILVIMDDIEVAKTPFTILELKPTTTD